MTRDILMLSWEYPPNIIGGLARHVAYLSRSLAKAGHRVVVLTQAEPSSPKFTVDEGVEVHRLPASGPPPRDFVDGVKQLNFQMIERAVQLFAAGRRFDIVHAHWPTVAPYFSTFSKTPTVITYAYIEKELHEYYRDHFSR